MLRALALLAIASASALGAEACTTFCVRGPDGLVFGRNYDYPFGQAMVLVNPRGLDKVSLVDKQPARWTSKFGSVTFNQYGKDNPMGGVNERGLVVELMELEEARYPDPDARPALGALEWIQYVLDNFASVEEALAGVKRVRVGTRSPLHFLFADRSGDAAVVEFLNGRMMVRRGDTLPDRVLANSTYDDSREYAAKPDAGTQVSRFETSLERFTRAARAVKAYEASPAGSAVERSFAILNEVAQHHTQWQVVYDLQRSTIHYRTTANPQRRSLAFAGLDYGCKGAGQMLDIDTGKDDVTAALMPYAPEANERQMLFAFAKTPAAGLPPPLVRAEAAKLESTRRCVAAG